MNWYFSFLSLDSQKSCNTFENWQSKKGRKGRVISSLKVKALYWICLYREHGYFYCDELNIQQTILCQHVHKKLFYSPEQCDHIQRPVTDNHRLCKPLNSLRNSLRGDFLAQTKANVNAWEHLLALDHLLVRKNFIYSSISYYVAIN